MLFVLYLLPYIEIIKSERGIAYNLNRRICV